MHTLTFLLFAMAGGLALSGIVANLYRLLARKPRHAPERLLYMGVMLLAGPSVLIDNATHSFRRKDCSGAAYAFAVSLTAYWSWALGRGVILLLWEGA